MPFKFSGLLAFFLFLTVTGYSQASQKLALIVAIDNYADPAWNKPRLHSLNDTPLVKSALISQGFLEKDITVLTNEKATKAGILSALDKLANAKPGAVVVFHFSGHGQQIFDIDDRRNSLIKVDEEDGYDEALVTYHSALRYSATDTGQHHLRDDELAAKYAAITKRIGPAGSFLVLLDACHSGNAAKGLPRSSRGTSSIFQRPGYKPIQSSAEKGYFSESSGQPFFSNFVIISASGSEQRNDETVNKETGQTVGALAYAFSKAIANLKSEVNYHVFFEWIKYVIQSDNSIQNPQVEGNRNLMVLGGGKNIIPMMDELIIVKWKNAKTVSFPRGQLHDIYENASFAL
ncbi:MAG: peptidase caspase catalytic subunit p20, partial [Chitinophagaceae bacterium]|nr:peptidase caspase catalytic subunit p20 [Chitinophagaceae bacterium]